MSRGTDSEDVFALDDLEDFLGLDGDDGDLEPYLDAAAVLAAFDPFTLRPAGPLVNAAAVSLIDRLLPRCEPITQGEGRGLWTLALPDRRAHLRKLGTKANMRQALLANPDGPDLPVQRMFQQVLRERPMRAAQMSRPELAALLTVHDWLDGIVDVPPPRTEIRRALARADVTAPMRRLAGEVFVDRAKEREQLRRHVTGPPAAPLFVHGPGGVGKSALLARLLLDEAGAGKPIAYLDIDRPTIRPDRPGTLLFAMTTQLASQIDVPPERMDPLITEIAHLLSSEDADRAYEGHFRSVSSVIRLFPPVLGDHRLLVVVDTFEEAQYLGDEVVSLLLLFLEELTSALPGLRIVIGGRTLPEHYPSASAPDPINLGVLAPEPARALLAESLASEGLPALSSTELDDVIAVVSRNPMCLKLAARLLRDEGVDRLRDARSDFLTHLRAEKIQALLYGRILRHLHSDAARAVAFPGLVVRRITPAVIREVLAGPCRLDLDRGGAERLFGELAAEVALVERDDDGSLRHRPDVRRSMLEDLTDQVPADVVEAIDRGAVGFYAGHDDPVSRAEEIYHRLRLRESPDILDSRWSPAAGARLRGAAEELPAKQRLWLARRLGITLDDAVRRAAGHQEWEDQVARRAGRYLQAGHAGDALYLVRERPDRLPRSPLYALEAEALRFLRRPDEALRVARAGVEAAILAGAVDMALDLLLKMVVIEEGRGALEPAARLAEEAEQVARHSSGDALRLRSTVTGLRLLRRRGEDRRVEALRHRLLGDMTGELRRALRTRPVLLREAAAELGADDPALAAATVEVLGFDVTTDTQARALGPAVIALTEVAPDVDTVFLTAARVFLMGEADAEFVRMWVANSITGKEVRQAGAVLARTAPGLRPLPEFRDYFRAGVDSALG
ncbi:hypothetical protein QLQ12_28970 [Actinoplanes sp. NEAU-A12]|uniref:AAA+ ATPase domain-containing protein n=1 Tax=Actinoplanes sandaracinus TaxID=3045177 RepID=A0ABT6WSG9_9ACTN|nr:hypothetical protein [Actinoplanes sandaracinus]MDI6102658.1 hypothetical protein [Actinoplanes sandaracinus]